MVKITDPDDLSQGNNTTVADGVWGSAAAAQVTITSAGTNIPSIAAGDYFEIRDHSDPVNNGLYLEDGGTPTTGSVTASKVDGVNPANAASESIAWLGDDATLANEKSVHFDTAQRKIWLLRQGNVVAADGIAKQAVYSFIKEEWKGDDTLIKHPFPMVSIDFTAGKYELGVDPAGNFNGWAYEDTSNNSRELVRDAGWRELNGEGFLGGSSDGTLEKEFAGIGTLGTFEDVADQAYYAFGNDPTDLTAAVDFVFPGPVNEAVLTYDKVTDEATGFAITTSNTITRTVGSWLTEGYQVGSQITIEDAEDVGNNGTFVILSVVALVLVVVGTPLTNNAADTTMTAAFDHRNAINLFLRIRDADPNGKTFAQAGLTDTTATTLGNFFVAFPLGNDTDLDISETDANIAANTPYTEIQLRYHDQSYQLDVDTPGSPRNFGITVDVGTYSMPNGVSNSTTLFTSAALSGITLGDYTGGVLIINEGADAGSHTIVGTPVNNAGTLEVTVSVALTATLSTLSFSLQRSTPVVASKNEIYEKVQFELRQAADVDETTFVVNGKTADELLAFVGPRLDAGAGIPTNPNGGGSGVAIIGFDPNDTNNLRFFDNAGTQREFPFVSAGTINFSAQLVGDPMPTYWMFFEYTERFTNTGFGISGASGSDAVLDSSVTDLVAELANGDHIKLDGFVNTNLNGIWRLTGAPAGGGPWTAAVTKIDRQTVANEAAGPSVSLDKNPVDSDDGIIVEDNSATPIGPLAVPGATDTFDFDYDNNVQGGRTAATDAAILLRAIGLDDAQHTQTLGIITRATGLSFTLSANTERNYLNV